jgi:hypothetical protein
MGSGPENAGAREIRPCKVLGIALLLTIPLLMLAADTSYPKVGKSWTVSFSKPAKVGGTVLPAGDYKVQHLKDGDAQVLVFKSGNKEKVRVACKTEERPSKADGTELTYVDNDGGDRVLRAIVFEGDRFRHELVLQ